MDIKNSTLEDLPKIFDLYRIATEFMELKKQVSWPVFSQELITKEINENRQWKITIDNKIACIWATTLSDPLIWGTKNEEPSVYIHRIVTNPEFRGKNLVLQLIKWAENYCKDNNLIYIRLDTVGLNTGLINHYEKLGFNFLGIHQLENTNGLPEHYNAGPVCFFERKVV